MECELCGCTSFVKEFGYFYCSECQTQSQEIREHVFQEDEGVGFNVKTSKKVRVKDEKEHKVTSWECYNIVTLNLTDQLITLGANPKLRRVIKCLWLKYLEKLEVINLTHNIMPKLQLVNFQR